MRTDGDWIKSCVTGGAKSEILVCFLRYFISFVDVIWTVQLLIYPLSFKSTYFHFLVNQFISVLKSHFGPYFKRNNGVCQLRCQQYI